jgi:hypothetical protein
MKGMDMNVKIAAIAAIAVILSLAGCASTVSNPAPAPAIVAVKISLGQRDAQQLRADFATTKVLLHEDKSISRDPWYVIRSMSRDIHHLASQVRALSYPASAHADARALATALDKTSRDIAPVRIYTSAFRLVFAGQSAGKINSALLAPLRSDMKIVQADRRALVHDLASS